MCEYCNVNNNEENLLGDDGIVTDPVSDKKYLFVAHFVNEYYRIGVNYCSQCGKKLT